MFRKLKNYQKQNKPSYSFLLYTTYKGLLNAAHMLMLLLFNSFAI